MPHVTLTIRWLARILGLLLTSLVVLFAIGEGFDPRELTPITVVMTVAFFAAAAGNLFLWRWELAGGLLVMIAMTIFYALNFADSGKLPSGWLFPMFFLPGALAIFAWATSRKRVAPVS